MGELKTMWKDMSKIGKFVLAVVIIIAVVVSYNSLI